MTVLTHGINKIKRYLITLLDISLFALSFIAFKLIYGQSCPDWLSWDNIFFFGCIEVLFIVIFSALLRSNANILKYATPMDYFKLILTYGAAFCFTFILQKTFLADRFFSSLFLLSVSCFALLLSLAIRIFFVIANAHKIRRLALRDERHNMIILGAGTAGASLMSEIRHNVNSPFNVRAFLDDDKSKIGKTVGDVRVVGPIEMLPELLKQYPDCDVILAIPSLNIERRREIIEMCEKLPCKFRIMPDLLFIMSHGNKYTASIRSVRFDDLLNRASVVFKSNELESFLHGKTVLITGGSGSIGSEISRQVASAGVKQLVIFDINENDSYMLYRELKHLFGNNVFIVTEIGDMTDNNRVEEVFERYKPDIVFHAAAHKHVPLMEDSPYEAVRNNVFGTWDILQAVKKYGAKKFVLISTDKAVNPTNVMGTTKRICETMCRAMACEADCKTDYVAVRFGNVLGSHGSVLPLFQMQIEHGGPITITDRRITRFFMTIPEAAGLVIKASAMANASDTFILDMGEPVRIIELAENFVKMLGYEPYKDIPIIETGLRPGEKLYEELLLCDGEHESTTESRIFIEKNKTCVAMSDMLKQLKMLKDVMSPEKNDEIIKVLRKIVPTFKTPEEVNAVHIAKTENKSATYLKATDTAE